MASGALGADESRERNRWGENSKVYTRKNLKKGVNKNNSNGAVTDTTAATADEGNNSTAVPATTTATTTPDNDNRDNSETVPQLCSQALATEEAKSPQQQQTVTLLDAVSGDLSSHDREPQITAQNSCEPPSGNGVVKPIITKVDNRVRINLEPARSKSEIRGLKRKLVNELDQVRSVQKRLEVKETELTTTHSTAGAYSHSQFLGNGERAVVRVNSEFGSVGYHDSRPLQQLSVSAVENNHGVGDFVEKEKRTPKANQYYRNSEFLLGKDRLPPAESNKKSKSNGGRKHSGETGYGFGVDKYTSQTLKSCNNLLTRVMKHKYAWVFNKPVDAKALGLHDYHDVIKNPMDLGTVKSRLSKNWYKSPREFAEDVRLTFCNAMTYNPKGQDVHIMADEMLKIFEEKWSAMESEYNLDWRYELVHDVGLPTPTSRKVLPPPPQPRVFEVSNFERVDSMTGMPMESKLKSNARVGRALVPKKPKANDPHKRDMTYEEKQRLSTNLQSLPSEKLDNIVQIIKKRNSTLSQHDDEIEVDIDSVDAETLWELDRFVTNYKKSLSKNKRKAELALQARAEATPGAPPSVKTILLLLHLLKEKGKGIMLVGQVVQAVLAVTRGLLQVILTVIAHLHQKQGIHLGLEWIMSRTYFRWTRSPLTPHHTVLRKAFGLGSVHYWLLNNTPLLEVSERCTTSKSKTLDSYPRVNSSSRFGEFLFSKGVMYD